MIYARSHRTIIDSWSLHCFEDTKANYSTMPKSELSATRFFGLPYLVFGLVFCSLWFLWVWVYWGREKREKEKSAVILRSASVSFCPLSVTLYTIERVLLSDAPSPLPLSPCSLSDLTSTSI